MFDPLIMARGTHNYYNKLTENLMQTQKFYRYFPYPNAGHCAGGGINAEAPSNALVDWVENGNAPDFIVATVSAGRTRKICKYPDVQVYDGVGDINDHNSFTCQVRKKDDPAVLADEKIDQRFEPKHIMKNAP